MEGGRGTTCLTPRIGYPDLDHVSSSTSLSMAMAVSITFVTAIALCTFIVPIFQPQSLVYGHHDLQSSSGSISRIRPYFPPLAFKQDGTFQISIFEDLHFGENAWDTWGPQQDIQTVKVMNRVLGSEPTADLVVLNGDLITGENTFVENSTHYIDQIVGPMVQRNLTWASTYGNHDSSFNLSREGMFTREKHWPNSRTASMVSSGGKAGVTNYYLPVYHHSSSGRHCSDNVIIRGSGDCVPALILWFFDSRGGFYFQEKDPSTNKLVGQPNWVDRSVVSWFKSANSHLSKLYKKAIPSLGFVHIPINATLALQNKGVDPHRQPGINDDVPISQQAQGWCADDGGGEREGCDYGGQDGPFMKAIWGTEDLIAVFTGHDHGDTWCYRWNGEGINGERKGKRRGVYLCFGQHSGYGGYGRWIRGGRQVVLSFGAEGNLNADTYIRLEDGRVVGAVSLNETYGEDQYPATPNDKTWCTTCM